MEGEGGRRSRMKGDGRKRREGGRVHTIALK